MTGKSIQFAANAVLMNRQKNLMIFNFTIFPFKPEKSQLKIYAFLNHFSMVQAVSAVCPSVVHTLQTSSPQKPLGQSKPNFIWGPHGSRERKFIRGGLGHITMPMYGKNPLKTIFFSGTKGPMTLGLGMQHWGLEPNKVCSNDDLGLTLTLFTARSILFLGGVYDPSRLFHSF